MSDYVQRMLMALGTVFTSRLVDSRLRALPALAAPLYLPEIPTVQVALGLSSSIAFLYYQLREGNMVNVSSVISNTNPVSQSRFRNSWFVRNLNSYRRRCTSAVRRLLPNPNDSLELIRTDTRNRSVNTFDSGQELRLRDSLNRRTIRRRGRSRRRRRPILSITRVRRGNIVNCSGDTTIRSKPSDVRPARTRSATRTQQAKETKSPLEAKKVFVKNKAQQVARVSIPMETNVVLTARKTRSGKIYGCS